MTNLENIIDKKDSNEVKVPRSRPKREAGERAPLNYASQDNIGGINFTKPRLTMDYSSVKKLDIPDELKNNELEYRWVNDDNGRVQAMTGLGYQPVPQDHFGDGITVARRVGTKKDGSELNAILMATPKNWRDERLATKQNQIKEREHSMLTGKTDGSGEALSNKFYHKQIKLETK